LKDFVKVNLSRFHLSHTLRARIFFLPNHQKFDKIKTSKFSTLKLELCQIFGDLRGRKYEHGAAWHMRGLLKRGNLTFIKELKIEFLNQMLCKN